MLSIAHAINVTEITEANKRSYLHVAQPVTMKSMVIARRVAARFINVDLVAVKHKDEKVTIPEGFVWAPDITNYAWEHIDALKNILPPKPLPRIVDILQSLYHLSTADYFIYTNLDIGLYPHFYLRVKELIELGYDAFCINRLDLPKKYDEILLDEDNIELILLSDGVRHPGIDCFVFRREIVPLLEVGNVFIGYPPVDQVLKTQIERHSENFGWFKNKKLTFHLGSDAQWNSNKGPYYSENFKEAKGLYVKCFQRPSLSVRIRRKFKTFLISGLHKVLREEDE